MPTAGASWIQECGAVAASLSLSSIFPHSGKKSSSAPCPGVKITELSAPSPTPISIPPTSSDNSSSSHLGNTNNKENVTDNNAEEYDRAAAIAARKEEAKT